MKERNEAARRTSRRDFLRQAATISAGLTAGLAGVSSMSCGDERAAAPAKTGRPNILLILADDLGRESLGCYGAAHTKMPELDDFSATGIRFDHCYATPKCHPSRAELMTGTYPFRMGFAHGHPRNQNLLGYRRLPQALASAGYETGIVGKWHLGGEDGDATYPRTFGFQDYRVWERMDDGERNARYFGATLLTPDGPVAVDDATYVPDFLNREAIAFAAREREQPYFLYYPMLLAHIPLHDPPGAEGASQIDRMIQRLDALISKLVQAVREFDAHSDRETLIIVTSDNGGSVEAGGNKGMLTDGGTRIPCMISWRGRIDAGRTSSALVDFSDFLPTLCEIAECPEDALGKGDGRSFAQHLLEEAKAPRDWVYSEWDGGWFVRNTDWKLHDDGRIVDMREAPEGARAFYPEADTADSASARTLLVGVAIALRPR